MKAVRKDKFADRQINWAKYIRPLKRYGIESLDILSIPGEAPKDFITDREYRPGHRSRKHPYERYIAKVGSKFYPLESVIEQMCTRIGQCLGLDIAHSKIRLIDGQVRFMSRYFLRGGEMLTHGAEIYERCLGKENYAELAEAKDESLFFTFQSTCGAIRHIFPAEADAIIRGYTEMLTFDAIIGHNDRHPYNWGVIVPTKKIGRVRFSPIFDTARAFFWNKPEKRVVEMLRNEHSFRAYVNGCKPPIGWDGAKKVDFPELIGLIWETYPELRSSIERLLNDDAIERCASMIREQFANALSDERLELVQRCLHLRYEMVKQAVAEARSRVKQ